MAREDVAVDVGAAAASDPLAEAPPRRHRRRVPGWVYPTATSLGVLLLWELLTPLLRIPPYILPPPSAIVRELWEQFPRLLPHIGVTAFEAVSGTLLSVAVAVPLAIAIVYLPTFERAVYPLLVSTQAIPKVALAPLFIVWFGFGLNAKVLIAFLVAFFPVVIDTVAGLKSVNPEYLNLARSMRATELQVLWRIRVPYALPHFFAGLKVAATFAVIGAIVGEFTGSDLGLGYVLLRAAGSVDTKLVFAVITLLSLLGVAMFYAVAFLERLLIPWHVSHRRRDG